MANYILLERIELNASAASVTFANIPQTGYTDLKVVWSARSARTGSNTDDMVIGFNGVNTNLTGRYVWGTGSAAQSGTDTQVLVGEYPTSTATANTFSNCEVYIPNYTSSNNKSFSADTVGENNGTLAYAALTAGLWSQTAAITSVTLKTGSGSNLDANSTFSLYGLAATGTTPAIAPKADGGNVIATDGTYWYHAFRSSGTFTPAVGLTCDVLVVAGGGGGGDSGGGGAGGLLGFASQSLTTISHTVTVGAGGAGGANDQAGNLGSDSQFASLTLVKGGGRGRGYALTTTGDGGSGGGGSGNHANSQSGGLPTSGQGNSGGSGTATFIGGGGGGAGGTGNAGSGASATGGIGSSAFSSYGAATSTGQNSAGTYYYAGGGGGGGSQTAGTNNTAGGLGGGGTGNATNASGLKNATANTGGGGGGTDGSGEGAGAGGSGIVIIRYTIA